MPFLRSIEVQVLDNGFNIPGKNQWYTTHGDVFPIHGSSMEPFGRHNGDRSLPSEERSKSSPEWNQYRIVCSNGVIRLHVNGKEVSGGQECRVRKGYLGLESEGAPVEFRHLRLRELASTGAGNEESAPTDLGWRSLFTGLDLRGWQASPAGLARWIVKGERLALKEGSASEESTLWTEREFGEAEFILDCRTAKGLPGKEPAMPSVRVRGQKGQGVEVKLTGATAGTFQRFTVTVKGKEAVVKAGDTEVERVALPSDGPQRGALGLSDAGGAIEYFNLYVREW